VLKAVTGNDGTIAIDQVRRGTRDRHEVVQKCPQWSLRQIPCSTEHSPSRSVSEASRKRHDRRTLCSRPHHRRDSTPVRKREAKMLVAARYIGSDDLGPQWIYRDQIPSRIRDHRCFQPEGFDHPVDFRLSNLSSRQCLLGHAPFATKQVGYERSEKNLRKLCTNLKARLQPAPGSKLRVADQERSRHGQAANQESGHSSCSGGSTSQGGLQATNAVQVVSRRGTVCATREKAYGLLRATKTPPLPRGGASGTSAWSWRSLAPSTRPTRLLMTP